MKHNRYISDWNVTSAGWQVTLCDLLLHVSSSSGVATSASELLYPCYCYFKRKPNSNVFCCLYTQAKLDHFIGARYASAVLAMALGPSVRLSVCHRPVLYENGCTDPARYGVKATIGLFYIVS